MTTDDALLDIRRLTVRYPRGRGRAPLTALHGVDLSLAAGETLGVVGESGSGKSTLANAVLGLVTPAAGTIRLAGEDITHASPRRRRALSQDIQLVFQDPHGSLNLSRTIGQTLEEPLLAHRSLRRAQRHAQVTRALERVRLDPDAAARYPARFSGGQLQRITIARQREPPPPAERGLPHSGQSLGGQWVRPCQTRVYPNPDSSAATSACRQAAHSIRVGRGEAVRRARAASRLVRGRVLWMAASMVGFPAGGGSTVDAPRSHPCTGPGSARRRGSA
jgi:ABC-type lipoprotein export system ATPase subunit